MKQYTSKTILRAARPRSERLKDQGIGSSISNNVVLSGGSGDTDISSAVLGILNKFLIPHYDDDGNLFSLEATVNLYSRGEVSAFGIDDSGGGGGGGTDLAAVWTTLTGNTGTYKDYQIHSGHLTSALSNYALSSSLATVATSGSYNDLSDKPTIPAAQIQSDWNQTTTTAKDYIKNKPTIPAAQIQSDWNQTSTSAKDYIKNKPTKLSQFTNDSNYVTSSSLTTTLASYATQTWVTNKGYATTSAMNTELAKYLPLAGGTMSNTNLVTNLNADLLDGVHASGLFTVLENSGNNISLTIGGTTKALQVAHADKSSAVGELKYIYFTKNDNSGHPMLLLVSDVSEWYSKTSTSSTTSKWFGMIGNLIAWRAGSMARNYNCRFVAAVSYYNAYYRLQSDNSWVQPMVVSYDSKYYLALKLTSASQYCYFLGYTHNLLDTFIKLNYSSSTALPSGVEIIYEGGGIPYQATSITASSTITVEGLLTANGNIKTDSYIEIGDYRIVADTENTALKVVHKNGTTAVNFYATGENSALGVNTSGGGGGGDGASLAAVWTSLGDSTGTYGSSQINASHLTNALSDYLPLTGGSMSNTSVVTNLNADLLDGIHASGLFTAFSNSGNDISITIGGTTKTVQVGYATSSNSATTLSNNRTIWGQSFNGSANVRDTLYMLSSTAASLNSPSAKLKFNSTGVDTDENVRRSPYIQALGGSSYGRMRLSIFQSNATNYTDDFVEAFTVLSNGNVGVNTISPTHKLHVDGTFGVTGQITSTVANGTAPLVVASSTLVSNLNADKLDGVDANGLFTALSNSGNNISVTIGGTNKTLQVGYATSAGESTTLATARTIWGQNFDGSANVSGNMTGVGSISASDNISVRVTNTDYKSISVGNSNGIVSLRAAKNRGILDDTSGEWLIASNGTDTFMSVGKVGIGTTSPSYKLHVVGTAYASSAFDVPIGTISNGIGYKINGGTVLRGSSDGGLIISPQVSNGAILFYPKGTGNTAGRSYISNDGNFGINTITPQYQLHIQDKTYAYSSVGLSGFAMYFRKLSTNTTAFNHTLRFIRHDSENNTVEDIRILGVYSTDTYKHTYFSGTYNNSAMRIDGYGTDANVGIGLTTAPSYKLHVDGDAYATKLYLNGSNFLGGNSTQLYAYIGTANPFVLGSDYIRRGTSDTDVTLGTSSYRWANLYSVLGNFSGQITSSVATGTSPLSVASTTLNTNLNADLLDGYHATELARLGWKVFTTWNSTSGTSCRWREIDAPSTSSHRVVYDIVSFRYGFPYISYYRLTLFSYGTTNLSVSLVNLGTAHRSIGQSRICVGVATNGKVYIQSGSTGANNYLYVRNILSTDEVSAGTIHTDSVGEAAFGTANGFTAAKIITDTGYCRVNRSTGAVDTSGDPSITTSLRIGDACIWWDETNNCLRITGANANGVQSTSVAVNVNVSGEVSALKTS